MRASPVLAGPLADAEAKLKSLGWFKDTADQWQCPVCTTRRTTKRKRFDGG
jgi:rubredoxin